MVVPGYLPLPGTTHRRKQQRRKKSLMYGDSAANDVKDRETPWPVPPWKFGAWPIQDRAD